MPKRYKRRITAGGCIADNHAKRNVGRTSCRSRSTFFTAHLCRGQFSDACPALSKMIVDNPSDVKCRTRLKVADFPQELIGLLGIQLYTFLVRIEPITGAQRVFQVLFELVNGANPILYLVGGDGFRSLTDFRDKILFPLIRTSFVKDCIFGGQLEHPFG